MFSCNKVEQKENINTEVSNKKTQALILTQEFEYDSSQKDKITGDYKKQKNVIVPQDLSPQNKWFKFEGPVLENDIVAYRYYADSRHRFDIFGKVVPDLVMDTVSWNYHDIMDWGSDIMKVGNSLGIGSPAIYYNDSLYTLSFCDRKEIQIVENSAESSVIRTIFTGLKIEDHSFDLIQDWSLNKGEAWSEVTLTVKGLGLPKGMHFASGFAKHLPEVIQGESNGIFYAMNIGNQSFHKENLGLAILVNQKYGPEKIEDNLNHAYFFNETDNKVSYRFLSVWERSKNMVDNLEEFKQLVEKAGENL
jgi:hypothetical protein